MTVRDGSTVLSYHLQYHHCLKRTTYVWSKSLRPEARSTLLFHLHCHFLWTSNVKKNFPSWYWLKRSMCSSSPPTSLWSMYSSSSTLSSSLVYIKGWNPSIKCQTLHHSDPLINILIPFPVPISVRLKRSMWSSKGVQRHFLKLHSLSSSTDTSKHKNNHTKVNYWHLKFKNQSHKNICYTKYPPV